jgi:molybdopterin synthase catalytic subunit
MSLPLFRLTPDPLDAAAVVALAEDRTDPGRFGAVVTFIGAVRRENLGRRVVRLEYEAYEPLAVKALQAIGRETEGRWPSVRLAIAHRIGSLLPGDASIVIAAASPHRADGFQACRYAIERVKQMVPIWKRECFEDGEDWIEGATADPDDETARALAYTRACG